MHRQIGILWDLDLKLSTAHSSASVPLHVIGFFFTSIHEGPRAMKKGSLARRLVSKNSQAGRSQHGAVMVIVFLEREVSQIQR
jgi:hypothetical protein